jgi:hypothetical protein
MEPVLVSTLSTIALAVAAAFGLLAAFALFRLESLERGMWIAAHWRTGVGASIAGIPMAHVIICGALAWCAIALGLILLIVCLAAYVRLIAGSIGRN